MVVVLPFRNGFAASSWFVHIPWMNSLAKCAHSRAIPTKFPNKNGWQLRNLHQIYFQSLNVMLNWIISYLISWENVEGFIGTQVPFSREIFNWLAFDESDRKTIDRTRLSLQSLMLSLKKSQELPAFGRSSRSPRRRVYQFCFIQKEPMQNLWPGGAVPCYITPSQRHCLK